MAYSDTDNGDWDDYRRLVLNELKRNTRTINEIQSDITIIKERSLLTQQELKIRSGIWGIIGGAVTVISVLLLAFVRRLF